MTAGPVGVWGGQGGCLLGWEARYNNSQLKDWLDDCKDSCAVCWFSDCKLGQLKVWMKDWLLSCEVGRNNNWFMCC